MMDPEKPLAVSADAQLIDAGNELVTALHGFVLAGCPICSGDCASADAPVVGCPMIPANVATRRWNRAKLSFAAQVAPTPLDELQTLGQQYDQPTTFSRFLTQEEQLCDLEAFIDDCADQGAFGGRG